MADRQKTLSQLLPKAQRGDKAALNLLCQELDGYIRGFFRQKFRDSSTVDDLCQETHLRLLRSLPTVREPTKLRGFVVKVAVHVTQDYFRAKYRRREDPLDDNLATDSSIQSGAPAGRASLGGSTPILEQVDLETALSLLPEKGRRIILMKAEGYKYEEIASETGLTVSGVKMQVKRCIELLRSALVV